MILAEIWAGALSRDWGFQFSTMYYNTIMKSKSKSYLLTHLGRYLILIHQTREEGLSTRLNAEFPFSDQRGPHEDSGGVLTFWPVTVVEPSWSVRSAWVVRVVEEALARPAMCLNTVLELS